jgi:hypothetical protein
MEGPFPDLGPVSMGVFGDTIAGTASQHLDSPNVTRSNMPVPKVVPQPSEMDAGSIDSAELPGHWFDFGIGAQGAGTKEGADLADHWLNLSPSLGASSTNAKPVGDDAAEVVDISRFSNTFSAVPIPPDVLPDEFEDFPADAWQLHHITALVRTTSCHNLQIPSYQHPAL